MSKKVIISFGRYTVPSIGHEKLFTVMSTLSSDKLADMRIYTSHTQDAKKNPLNYKQKIKFLKLAFPSLQKNIIVTAAKTIFEVLKEIEKLGYTDVTLVAGEDRAKDFRAAIKPYINTNHKDALKFDKFQVVNAGSRDPDSDDDVESMSASKLRELAVKGKFKEFAEGLPKALTNDNARVLYNIIRAVMLNDSINNTSEGTMAEEKCKCKIEKKKGYSPKDNPSKLWQSFRQWFYIMDEETEHNKLKDEYKKLNLQYLKLTNKALKGFAGSPRQKRLRDEYVKVRAELDKLEKLLPADDVEKLKYGGLK